VTVTTQFPGIGGRAGLGERPALVVVDMSVAFTDASSPLGCELEGAIAGIQSLLAAARENGEVPVVFTTVAYGARERVAARALLKKMPAALMCEPGSHWNEIDERLAPEPEEPLITKVFPSAFFGTGLVSYLVSQGCDSVIVTGASTSGCVRATVVDAVSHGYSVVVPREAVGDRLPSAHEASLVDIEMKYGDVLPVSEVVEWLEGAGRRQPARSS
jgi:maleamate amidohydrolase